MYESGDITDIQDFDSLEQLATKASDQRGIKWEVGGWNGRWEEGGSRVSDGNARNVLNIAREQISTDSILP